MPIKSPGSQGHRRALVAAVSLAVIGVGVAVWRTTIQKTERERDRAAHRVQREETVRASQVRFASIPSIAVESLSDAESWRSVLTNADISGDTTIREASTDLLLRTASEFLRARFFGLDIGEYVAWRQGRGYRPVDPEKARRDLGVHEYYQELVGEPFPEPPDMARVFASVLRAVLDRGDDVQTPVAVASSPEGVVIRLGYSAVTSRGPDVPHLDGQLGENLWHGGSNSASPAWWSPPTSYQDVALRDGGAAVATIGIITKFATGDYRAMVMVFFWDRDEDSWYLYTIQQFNTPQFPMTGLVY